MRRGRRRWAAAAAAAVDLDLVAESGKADGEVEALVRVWLGARDVASKMSQKACLEFVAAPQPARAARKRHRSRVGRTSRHPVSAADQTE